MAGSATVGILRVLLTANSAEFESAMKRSASAAQAWSKDIKSIGQQATQLGSALTRTLTVPLLGLGVGAAKLAMDFESSFAGVRKTVKATEPEFAAMAQGFRDLSKQIPVNVNELNRLGEAAGALGIPKAEVVDFARVMALLGVTTNVTSDQAAEGIAKIQNIFGAAGKDTERFASTLVALGNDGASTESQILEMATRIAGAGNVIGLTQGQVLAFASALSSVGLEAEAGGSAISRVFLEMASSVSAGGDAIAGFAQVAGQSVGDFSKLFKEDAATAVNQFILGLSKIKDSGGDLIGTLTELGFTEIRVRDALLRAAGAGDLLTKALNTEADAWSKNNALMIEARERFKTTESQLTVLWQRVKDVGITLGNALLPSINLTISALTNLIPVIDALAKGFGALPTWVQATAIGFGLAVAAAGPLLWIFGQLATSAGLLIAQFTTKGLVMRGLTALFPTLTAATTAQAVANTATGTTATAAAGGLTTLRIAAISLGTALGAIAVVGVAAVNVFQALSQWSKLSSESAERASMAANEQARRYAMIAEASKIAGHSIHDYATAVLIVTEHSRKLADEIQRGAVIYDQAAGPPAHLASAIGSVGDAASGLTGDLKKAQAAVNALTKDQRANIDAGLKMGLSTKEIVDAVNKLFPGLKLTEQALDLYKDGLKGATKETKDLAAETKKLQEQQRDYWNWIGERQMEDAAHARQALEDKASALRDYNNFLGERRMEDEAGELSAIEAHKKAWREYYNWLGERRMEDDAEAMKSAFKFGDALKGVLKGIPSLLEAAFTGGGGILGWLKGLAVQFGDVFATAITDGLKKAFGVKGEGGTGTITGTNAMKGAAGLGLVTGIGAASSGASTGRQLGAVGMAGIGVGVSSLIAAGTLTAATITTAAVLAATTAGIGLAVVAAVALYKKYHMAEWEKLGKDIGRDFGVALSKETLKAWEKESKVRGRQAVGILHLAEIIEAAGGLTDKNLAPMMAKLHDVFSLIEMGQISVSEGTKILEDNWESFAAAGTDASGRISKGLKEIIALNQRFGTESKAIAEFLKQQASNASTGFGAIAGATSFTGIGDRVRAAQEGLAGATKARAEAPDTKSEEDLLALDKALTDANNELTEALRLQKIAAAANKSELADLGVIALATFNATMKATGGDFAAALQASSGGLSTLKQAYDDLGISTDNAGLRALFLQNTILDKNPALIAGISGLSQTMVALDNMGMLNVETFDAMQRAGAAMYTRLQFAASETAKANGDLSDQTAAALLPMQKFLQDAVKQAELLNVPLDETTQSMIAQSKQLGIWKDIGPSAIEESTEATKELAKVMFELSKGIRELLGDLRSMPGDLPNPFRNWTRPDLTTQPEPVPLASGAIVRRATLALIGERGPEIVAPLSHLGALAQAITSGRIPGVRTPPLVPSISNLSMAESAIDKIPREVPVNLVGTFTPPEITTPGERIGTEPGFAAGDFGDPRLPGNPRLPEFREGDPRLPEEIRVRLDQPVWNVTQPIGEPVAERIGTEPGHALGTMGRYGRWFKDFGAGMGTRLHGLEAVITPSQAVPFAASVLQNSIGALSEIMKGGLQMASGAPERRARVAPIDERGPEVVPPVSYLQSLARSIIGGLIPGVPAIKAPSFSMPDLEQVFNPGSFRMPEEIRVRLDESLTRNVTQPVGPPVILIFPMENKVNVEDVTDQVIQRLPTDIALDRNGLHVVLKRVFGLPEFSTS